MFCLLQNSDFTAPLKNLGSSMNPEKLKFVVFSFRECNSRNQVFEVFNDLYSTIYHSIYRIWKTQHKNISDSGFVIHEVETQAKKNPVPMMKTYQKVMNERKNAKVPTAAASESKQGSSAGDKIEKFIGVCDLEDKKEDAHFV